MILAIVGINAVLGGLSFLFFSAIIFALVCRVVRKTGTTAGTITTTRQHLTTNSNVTGRRDPAAGALSLASPNTSHQACLCSWYLTSGELSIFQSGLNRILMGLLAYNVLLSLALALSTFMVPSEFEGPYSEYSKGTPETCRFQG